MTIDFFFVVIYFSGAFVGGLLIRVDEITAIRRALD